MTLEELKENVPKHARNLVTQRIVDVFNKLEEEDGEEFAEVYKQNFISMSSVLKSKNYRISDYLNAVKYASYKLLDNSDIDAYHMTFPDRYKRLIDKWKDFGSEEDIRMSKISPYVNAYKKSELVQKVLEQTLVPSHILNAPLFQEALNVQVSLMYGAKSEMVRQTAAESVLKYTKPPETQKIELEVGIKGQDEVQALRDEMSRLAAQQQQSISTGQVSSTDVAESVLIAEVVESD
jgi:hypothetical protein